MNRDALERRYDGPIPPADPAHHGRAPAEARARLFDRLAAETRSQAAGRRARLPAGMALGDQRLSDWCRDLADYRRHGVGWR